MSRTSTVAGDLSDLPIEEVQWVFNSLLLKEGP